MSSDSFKNNVTYKLFAYKSYIYQQDLELHNPRGLICHKTQPNPTKPIKRFAPD